MLNQGSLSGDVVGSAPHASEWSNAGMSAAEP